MSDEDFTVTVDPVYAFGQLARAVERAASGPDGAARTRAAEKVRRWESVIAGLAAGTISVGSRTPVRDVPAWATLEVAHGGFATGALLAEGSDAAARNRHYASDEGLFALVTMLRDGRYRVNVPEEGALLAVAWLLDHGHADAALDVLDAVAPFLDRLRFYPSPAELTLTPTSVVRLQTVAECVAQLEAVKASPDVDRMNETLRLWTPLYDRAVALFMETVEDDWPCRRYPDGWPARALALVDEYAALRAKHRLSGKPDDPKENFCRLRTYLARCARDPRSLTGRDVGRIRSALASFAKAHGEPGSARRRSTREAQARAAALPSNKQMSAVVVDRLRRNPADAGIPSLDAVAAPLDAEESARTGGAEGMAIPAALVKKAERCLEAPVDELVERGVIPSADVLAMLLPEVTAQVAAQDFADPELRRLYGALYAAFRKRRSLLLVDLASQVRFEELPWVAALAPLRRRGADAAALARETLRQMAALALASFPESIVPNKLLQEFVALAKAAALDLPLVEEIAADIFTGAFSAKFLRAAQVAGRLLGGTVYARYYGAPYDRLMALDDAVPQWGATASPGFAAACTALARGAQEGAGQARSVAHNGTVVEQSLVLTTHNLAALWSALSLGDALGDRAGELARRCFAWLCARLQVKADDLSARRIAVKLGAYAWRQMMFFLAVADDAARGAFLPWAGRHLAEQGADFRDRFEPAMAGLRLVWGGGGFDAMGRGPGGERRFLGWNAGRHWLLA
jgi:hypothetical protein